jgi:DNA-binding transcriptional ArsR family regulator
MHCTLPFYIRTLPDISGKVMSSSDPLLTVCHALKHDLRREILSLLEGGPKSYTGLLRALGVESGLLAYHLRSMGALVEKDGNGRYVISDLGCEAVSLMERGSPPRRVGSRATPWRTVKFVFVFLMVASVLSNAYLVASLQEINQSRAYATQATSDETLLIVEDSLSTIYSVYERMGVDRGCWTELLLSTVQIRTNLCELDDVACTDEKSAHKEDAISLDCYVEEFTRVLKSDDREYFELTFEKRYLIRELHADLLVLRERLS